MPDGPDPLPDRPPAVDPRPQRIEQGLVALLLLAGFAFRIELVIPITTVLLAIRGAVGPERGPFVQLLALGMTDRMRPVSGLVDAQTLRLAVIVQTAILLVASLIGFIGLEPLAWLIALAVAGAAVYDATTGTWALARLYWRFARRSRP